MSRKAFTIPFILSTGNNPGDDIVIGGGTGEGGSDPIACSFNDWLRTSWADDYDNSGNIDIADYTWWWEDAMYGGHEGFTQQDWEDLNPGVPWPFGN